MAELEKTCENCEYEFEDIEGRHCKHCIHNATENFEPKKEITKKTEIRAKAIDEFAEKLKIKVEEELSLQIFIDEDNLLDQDQVNKYIDDVAEQLKAGGSNDKKS